MAVNSAGISSEWSDWLNVTINASIPPTSRCLGGSLYDYGYSIQQTTDGGYIAAGYTYSNDGDVSGSHGGSDAWIVKLDSNNAIQWQKCLGTGNYDGAISISQTADGGYIFSGSSYYSYSYTQAWVAKTSSRGELEWQKYYLNQASNAYSIQQTTDGGYILAGDTQLPSTYGYINFSIIKLSPNGAPEWIKSLGGSNHDYGRSIQQTSDGGYIAAGYTYSNDGDVSGNHGSTDYWVVKLASDGIIQWQKCLGGSSSDQANSIKQTADGGYIVAGSSSSNDGDVSLNQGSNDFWVVKLNSEGAPQWQRCLGGSSYDVANEIQLTADGGYVVIGSAHSSDGEASYNHGSSDYLVVKLASNGATQWQKCLGGSNEDYGQSIQQTADGGYITAGYTYSNNGDVSGNHGYYDFWVAKIKSDINFGNIDIDLIIEKNAISETEQVPIKVKVSRNSKPIPAEIALSINGKTVAGFSGPELTYLFGPHTIGNYDIMATASVGGLTERKPGKITVTGDVSNTLVLANKLRLSAQDEIYQSEEMAIKRHYQAIAGMSLIAINDILFNKLNILKLAINKVYPPGDYPAMGAHVDMFLKGCNKVAAGIVSLPEKEAIAFIFNVFEQLGGTYPSGSKSIKDYKDAIETDFNLFNNFIITNDEKFADSSKYVPLFKLHQIAIGDIVETREVTSSLIGNTEYEQACFYDNLNDKSSLLSKIIFASSIIVALAAGFVAIYYCLSLVLGCIIYILSSFGPIIGTIVGGISWIAKGLTIMKFVASIFLLITMPYVCYNVYLEHHDSIADIEAHALSASVDAPKIPLPLSIQVNNSQVSQSNMISANGNIFIIRPDGKISCFGRDNHKFATHKSGNYTVFGYQHTGNLFSSIASKSFMISDPNVTLNTSYILQDRTANFSLQVSNHEINSLMNLTVFLDIKNSTNYNVYSNGDCINLSANESKNVSFEANLEDDDIYTVTATVLQDLSYILAEKTFSIPIGVSIVEDAAILKIDHKTEYSPHESVALNVTIQSLLACI